jgi:uncharacterized delta-60 repeat protein
MALDPAGNLYIAGRSQRPLTNSDYSLIKYDPDGVEQWVAAYNGPDSSSENVSAIAVDISGNIYLTGSSDVYGAGSDWATIKYTSDGVEQWVARFNGLGNSSDIANDLAVDESGNVYVTGYATSAVSAYNLDFTTIKYNESGVEQWVSYYEGPGEAGDDAKDIALDDSGNVYITGTSFDNSANYDYATIKYNNDGIEQWVVRYNGSGNSTDIPVAIAIDNQRNIVVSGASKGDGTNYDFVTVQYNSAGIEQWANRYNGTENKWDYPEALAINEKDEIFVTGYGESSYGYDDFVTVKYDQSGSQKWVSTYEGPSYKSDRATGLAIGENGYIYVTGRSDGFYGSVDYATVKINPEGHREWVMRYDAGFDQPADVVTDGLGHIYVTGYSIFDYDTETLCTTIKYTDPTALSIKNDISTIPGIFQLNQNYPNPFNPETVISWQLAVGSEVELSIYNILGAKVATLVKEYMSAGTHTYHFNGINLASGVYYYHLFAGEFQKVRKMVLIK